ncbi:MAG TPA: response regulator [Bryobacteraceae bacterium]|jgi:CheY-like chemotaxis protein|nr:response regulator [Bryobacteraceae bacterium]
MTPDNFDQLSLLVVEDSVADVFLVKEAIKEEGLKCRIEVADDGEEAIRILDSVDSGSQGPPSLLLVDLNVPRHDGTQVLERLRRSPRCKSTPVVMMSTSDTPAERKRAFDLGVTEYFCKPSSLAEFMELGKLVRRLLEEEHGAAA